jgi:hypothetical protein
MKTKTHPVSDRECIYQLPTCREWLSLAHAAVELETTVSELRALCESDPTGIEFQYAGDCGCGQQKLLISREAIDAHIAARRSSPPIESQPINNKSRRRKQLVKS